MSEVDRLRDRIEELEELLGTGADRTALIRHRFGLRYMQAKLLAFLSKRTVATRSAIFTALYGDVPEADWPDEGVIKVLVCQLREKLEGTGIEITTHVNTGYGMSDKSRSTLELALYKEAA